MADGHTLVHRLAAWAAARPDRTAIAGKHGDHWHTWTWARYWADVRDVAKALLDLGLAPGECVALVGDNRPEWVLCEFGIMAAGGIPAPIYTTSTPEQTAYIVQHSQARIAICDTAAQLEKYLACFAASALPIAHIVVMDDVRSDDPRVLTFAALARRGAALPDAPLDARLATLKDTDTALLIYTSGTTGTPKAVQLEHGQMIEVASAIADRFALLREDGAYRTVSYLPLCHVAEQLFTNFMHLETGGEVYFCPDLALLKEYLAEVRPSSFLGVPRVWEKFQAALTARLAGAPWVRRQLADWALRTELAAFQQQVATGRPVDTLARRLANRLVISKIKAALGLDRLIVAATGAAPIGRATLEFFASIGVVVYEGYGMSETTGVSHVSSYGKPAFGTVGQPLRGVECRIADDGEVLLRGRIMTKGYLRQPELTAELLDAEGWLHTGDLGSVDETGALRITGRKKDLIITAGGKNVAPAEMEAYLQQIPGVGQAVVLGDRQPFLTALFTVDAESLAKVNELLGLGATSVAEVAADPRFVAYLTGRVEQDCNTRVARYQTIKKFRVLPVEFSVDGGELTPTMKLKRNVITDKYASEIAAMYVET